MSTSAASAHESHPLLGWTTDTIDGIGATSADLGISPAAISTYAPFTQPFPQDWATEAARRGVPLVLSWEPWDWSRPLGQDQPEFALAGIAAGVHDDYLRSWAHAAATSGTTVLLRFAPEMNGDWHAWSIGDTPQDYVRAWRHVHRVFEAAGASNVKWVFNPSVEYPGSTPIAQYWPGRAYVDWLGVDGYNWEGVLPGRRYESASDVFAPTIASLQRLDPHVPVMIAECAAGPAAKDRWIPDLATTAPSLGVSLVIWFEHEKEADWRLTTARLAEPLATLLVQAGWRVPPA